MKQETGRSLTASDVKRAYVSLFGKEGYRRHGFNKLVNEVFPKRKRRI